MSNDNQLLLQLLSEVREIKAQNNELQVQNSEIIGRLERIESHVVVIRGAVIGLEGISKENKEAIERNCEEYLVAVENNDREFEPVLNTEFDPRNHSVKGWKPEITNLSKKEYQELKRGGKVRVTEFLPGTFTHGQKCAFGDSFSSFLCKIFGYKFYGKIPQSLLSTLIAYTTGFDKTNLGFAGRKR